MYNAEQHVTLGGDSLRRQFFSLIEVLIAVIILVIMMGMMLYIISAAQRSFKLQESKTVMYQKSRLIFDLVERDIRSMVTSQSLYREIGFYTFLGADDKPDAANDLHFTIVTSADPDDASTSRLSEVTYAFHDDPSEPGDRFILRRQVVSQAHGDDWNFVGTPPGWQTNKLLTSPDFQSVVGGVSDFQVLFYELGGSTAAVGESTTAQPIRVVVNIDLFDEAMSGSEFDGMRSRHTRGFTKVFYLGHIHSR